MWSSFFCAPSSESFANYVPVRFNMLPYIRGAYHIPGTRDQHLTLGLKVDFEDNILVIKDSRASFLIGGCAGGGSIKSSLMTRFCLGFSCLSWGLVRENWACC